MSKQYVLKQPIRYYSRRYNRRVNLDIGYESDGATGAIDLHGEIECLKDGEPFKASESWWVHDKICDTGKWEGGVACTNWQASMVLRDILKSEGHTFRYRSWTWATFFFGGGKARKNKM